jgi:nitric oxide dioxygenase
MFLHAANSPDSFALRGQVSGDPQKLADASLVTWFAEQSNSTQVVDGELVGFRDGTAVELYEVFGPDLWLADFQ